MKISKATLEKLYTQDKKSCREIGLLFNKSNTTIHRLLKKHSIQARPFSTKGLHPNLGKILSEETKDKIRQKHLGKKLSPEHRAKVIKTLQNGQGSFNPAWKGGRTITGAGYIKIKMRNHPYADNQGYVSEHRLVMEAHLKRVLSQDEHVHHINEIKTDNRIENLLLTTIVEHRNIHWQDEQKRKERGEFISELRKSRFWSTKKILLE